MMANSFFGCLETDQIYIFIEQAEQELARRDGPSRGEKDDKRKRAERFGIPFSGEDVLGRALYSSRKVKADKLFDDTKVIRRNRVQKAEFIDFLDKELDEYAQERDRIISEREKEYQ